MSVNALFEPWQQVFKKKQDRIFISNYKSYPNGAGRKTHLKMVEK